MMKVEGMKIAWKRMNPQNKLSSSISEVPEVPTVNRRIWRITWSSMEFRIGLLAFVVLVLGAVMIPMISPHDPIKMNLKERFIPPAFMENGVWNHPIGTDQLGRDLLVRSMIGLRYSLFIGISSTALMFLVGSMIGIISGFKSKLTDAFLMRLCDINMSIPVIILAITILGIARPNMLKVITVLALAGWPLYGRVVRSVALAEREKEYIRGSRILGASDWRIMMTLLVPTILPPMAFVGVMDVARMMVYEAILGYIGLGIQPPTPTFGTIIADGRKYMLVQWWICSMPGIFLFITLTSLNIMGASLERARNKVLGGLE